MAYLSGQSGSLVIGSTTYCVESWTLNINTEALDTTTTCSSGWEENIAGISTAEGSAKAFWDASAQPTDTSGFNIRPGVGASIKFNIGNSGKFFTVPCRITGISIENGAKGVVSFSFNFKGNGSLTYPT